MTGLPAFMSQRHDRKLLSHRSDRVRLTQDSQMSLVLKNVRKSYKLPDGSSLPILDISLL